MKGNAINLALRFILEMSALLLMGMWGWQLSASAYRFLLAGLIHLAAAAIWGIFAVPADPSRSGKAPVPVPGIVRLIIELLFFGLAVFCAYKLRYSTLSLILAIATVAHYLFSHRRIRWLLGM